MPEIRRAIHGDEEAICDAHMRSILEVCANDYSEEEIEAWGMRPKEERIPMWEESIDHDYCLVVEASGKIEGIATMILPKREHDPALILSLYLTPKVLGLGIGSKLLDMMISHAKSKKIKSVVLDATLTAHDFYKSKGFIDTEGIITREIRGCPVRCIPMAKQI